MYSVELEDSGEPRKHYVVISWILILDASSALLSVSGTVVVERTLLTFRVSERLYVVQIAGYWV